MTLKKTVIVNESAVDQRLVQAMFSRGVIGVSGQRPTAARWEFVGGTLAHSHLMGKRS